MKIWCNIQVIINPLPGHHIPHTLLGGLLVQGLKKKLGLPPIMIEIITPSIDYLLSRGLKQ